MFLRASSRATRTRQITRNKNGKSSCSKKKHLGNTSGWTNADFRLAFRSGRVRQEHDRQTDEDTARQWFQRSVSFIFKSAADACRARPPARPPRPARPSVRSSVHPFARSLARSFDRSDGRTGGRSVDYLFAWSHPFRSGDVSLTH
jgi:hypothetical protein